MIAFHVVSRKLAIWATIFSLTAIVLLGIPTAVIHNRFYTRMTPVYWFDYVFLVINSILIGTYYAMTFVSPAQQHCTVEKRSFVAQGLSFVGIACPICNKVLLLLFSTTFLLTVLEPIRPYLSLTATGLLLYLLYRRLKALTVTPHTTAPRQG